MVEKLRDYFEEMVVYKDLKNNNFFSSLGLPAFLRDYLLKTFSDDYGRFDMEEVSAFIKKYIPKKEDWMRIKNQNNYENEKDYVIESVKFLINNFYKMGRPKSIYVRDEETKMYLKDIADKAKIKLIVKAKLKSIDEFYNSLSRMGM